MATAAMAPPARAGKNKQYSNDVAIFFWGGDSEAHNNAAYGFTGRANRRGSDFRGVLTAKADYESARACHEKLAGFWNQESRLYLCGHGNWRLCTLARHSPEKIALFLRAAQMPKVKMVSVVSCNLGRGVTWRPGRPLTQHCETSFGAKLYAHIHILCEKLAVRTIEVAVGDTTGKKKTRLNEAHEWQHHQAETKIVFSAAGYQVLTRSLDQQLDDIIDDFNEMLGY